MAQGGKLPYPAPMIAGAAVVVAVGLVYVFQSLPRWMPTRPPERTAESDAAMQRQCEALNLTTIRQVESAGTCPAELTGADYDRCLVPAATALGRPLRDCRRCSGGLVSSCMVRQ